MKKILPLAPAAVLLFPLSVYAATSKTLGDLIGSAIGYLNEALALLMGLAVVMFVFYILRYFVLSDEKREEGRQYLVWSMIGFFVIFSMWGIVNILIATFDVGTGSPGSWSSLQNLFPQ